MPFLKEIPFYYLLTTSFQPSSCLLPFLGLGKVDTLVVAVVVVRVTAKHWAAAVATVIGESALWGVVWVIMVVATTLVISAVFITLMTSLDLKRETRDTISYCLLPKRQGSRKKVKDVIDQNFPQISYHRFCAKLTYLACGLFGRDTKMKLLAFVFFFTFLSCNCLRFGQFQISRSTLCFTLPPKNRLSNVDFSWGLQTSQKWTANNNC